MQKRRIIRILDVILIVLFLANIVSYTHKRETKLLHANYKVLVQESAGSSNYVEYPGYNFPKRGYTLASYTCDSNATITQNNISKKISFSGAANKCTLKFDISSISTSQTLQKLQELSSQWNVNDGTPDFSKTSPVPVYVDNGFNGNSVNVGLVNENYITYAASYTFNTETGKYSLTNAASCQVSNVLCRQYIENGYYVVDVTGVASSTPVTSTNLDKIYKITDTHGTWTGSYSADYIESSVLTNYNYSDCGVYHSTDDYGTSYYVRGAYDYNYVKFGKNSSNQDLYWRIVRINGDESLRMIYAGTSATAKSDIGKSKFNETQNDNTYVGYMTGTTSASSYALAHNNSSNSTIKTTLDNWYNENLLKDDDKIEYGLFCNDRSLQSGNGYGMDTTYYKSYNRNITNKAPSLLCPEKNDRFTVNDTNIGNGKLTRPIGLITEDELAYGGMVNNKSNTKSYLSKTDSYWTMTPADFATEKAWVMGYYQNQLKVVSANSNMGVVPVINLTPEAVQAFTGTGTASNPFVISEDGTTTNPSISLLNKIQSLVGSDSSLVQDGTTDNNIRYIGANPNNYISFNGELWRIIGVMNNVKDANGNSASRVKIVRNGSIGMYSWDSTDGDVNLGYGANDYSQSKVMQLLNGGYESNSVNNSLYWNKGSGNCYNKNGLATTSCSFASTGLSTDSKYLIDEVVWNTGAMIKDDFNSAGTGVVSNLYTYERGTASGKTCSGIQCVDSITRYPTWTGKVGLIYLSDYGYATGGGTSKTRNECLNYYVAGWADSGYSDCHNNDWLFLGTKTYGINGIQNSSSNSGVAAIDETGIIGGLIAFNAFDIRPSLYLKQDVSYISGSGTQSDPFVVR